MRSSNPNVLLQQMFKHQLNIKTPATQYEGILDAKIIDTHVTNPSIADGKCRVIIPGFNDNMAFGPIEYPGEDAPPNGTDCVVGFLAPQAYSQTSSSDVRVLAFYGFGGGSGTNIDGGSPSSVYTPSQHIDGGSP